MTMSVFRAGRSLASRAGRAGPTFRTQSALAGALLATTALAAPGFAQVAPTVPPNFQHLDANGVDLVTGEYAASFVEGSIGPAGNALVLRRLAYGNSNYESFQLYQAMSGSTTIVHVVLAERTETFTSTNGTTFTSTSGNGSTLTVSYFPSFGYIFRTAGGTEIAFRAPEVVTGSTPFCRDVSETQGCRLVAMAISEPTGASTSFDWSVSQQCNPWFEPDGTLICNVTAYKLEGVSNSGGYEIDFTYSGTTRTGAVFRNAAAGGAALATVSYNRPSSTVTDVTDIGGRVWRFTNDANGRLIGVRRPGAASDTTTITYGANGVSSVTSGGVTTGYSRVISGSTVTMTVTNALNQSTVVTSSLTTGRPSSITDPLNRTTSFLYDGNRRLTRMTAPEGNYVQYSYDGRGNVTQVQRVAKPGSGEATITTSSSFAASCSNPVTCNQPLTTTDARGNVTDYSYDPNHGGLIMATGPAPSAGAVRPQTRYGYANIGGILRLSEISACQTLAGGTPPIPLINDPGTPAACDGTADEVVTTLGYDANGNITSVASGAGDGSLTATITSSYDAMGNLITIDGPLAGAADTTRLRYNAARELVGMVSADPDGAGALPHRAVRNIIDGQGLVTRVDIGTVASQSDADWASMAVYQSTEIDYDPHARPVVERLTSGGTTYALNQLSYDALGRRECVAQRMNPAAFGALPASACTLGTEGTFGPDRIARTVYDAAGQVSQVQTAYGTPDQANEVSATYTANGLVQTLTDGAGNRTTFVHDGHDRLSRTRYPVPTVGANTSSTTDYEEVGYDAASHVVSFRNRAGQLTAFTHDALGRMTSVNRPGAEPDATYAYDLLGRMTSASQPGHALSFTYDALGRPLTETGPQGTVSSSWDVAGRRTRVTYPGGGLYVEYDYNLLGEMTRVRENGATSGVGVLATYGYDSLGRRTSLIRGNGTSTIYGYDAVSRLTSLGQNLAGTTNDLTLGVTYNPAGQIVGTTRSNDAYAFTGLANGSQSVSVNGLNQVTAINGTATAHDDNGNMTNDGTRSYGYRSDNAMTSASGGVSLSYDPSGRLHQVASGAGTTRFMHDRINLVAEYDGADQLQRRFVHGAGIDEPLVEYVGSGTSNRQFLHADERGSVIGQTDGAGVASGVNRYDEYGGPQSGNIGRFQYTGLPWLGEVNLQYSRARMMNPRLGRFMQPDPIGYGDGMNLYVYVGNDPMNFADPLGRARGCVRVGNGEWNCNNGFDWFQWMRQFRDTRGGGFAGRGERNPFTSQAPNPQTRSLTRCEIEFAKTELSDRSLPTHHLSEVTFIRSMGGGDLWVHIARLRGHPAITRGASVLVRPGAWEWVTDPRNETFWSEVVHTSQYQLGAFDSEYATGVVGSFLTGGNGWRNNIMEEVAHRVGEEMATSWNSEDRLCP